MLSRRLLIFAVSACLFAQAAPPQQEAAGGAAPQPPRQPASGKEPIRVQVNEVIVPVTVTDEKGRFVSDLDAKDFRVFDEGVEQKIRYFSRERSQPVVVGFLFDLSNSTRLHWKTYQEAAMELVFALMPDDPRFSGYLITYSTDAELQVNTTNDSAKIVEKMRKLRPGGGAALYDAIWMACTRRQLVKGEPIEPRRVLVVIGDGNDNASKRTLQEVIEIAQRNLVTIYGVSTVAFGFNTEGEKNLIRLAEETGGRIEYPLQGVYKDVSGYLEVPSDEGNYALKVGTGGYATAIAKGIFRAIANVAGEVTTQYIIRYIPEGVEPNRTFRSIRVEVGLASVKIRARKGYYPEAP
ncbi:MAG: VWA domain-containing protein [Acidobacteria bacterium]|nr:VWA domain-containing protein [Acidobacteriota bacterium]